MYEPLMKLLVKGYGGDPTPQVREKSGRAAGAVGIATNLLLFAIKLIAGLLSHSVAILADAVNNLTDSGSSIIMLVGFKLAGKPADKEHPFGHARIEYLSSMAVAVLILLLGVELAQTSLGKIFSPEEAAFSWLTVGVLVLSILAKLWLYRFNRSLGRRIDSELMAATAADSLSDVLATTGVLVSAAASPFLGFSLDGYMGVLVAVFILRSGGEIIREAMDKLLGQAPTGELVAEIESYVRSYDGVMDCHDLVVHSYGPGRCFATVHAEVPAGRDIMASHDIIDNIERDIFREKGIHLVIHMDPVVTDDVRVEQLRRLVREVLAEVGTELTFHDFRIVAGPSHTNMIFDISAPFAFPLGDSELCRRMEEKLKERDNSLFAVITVDRR